MFVPPSWGGWGSHRRRGRGGWSRGRWSCKAARRKMSMLDWEQSSQHQKMLLKCLGWKKKDIKAWPRGAVFLRWKSYLGEDALVASLKEPSEVFQDNIPHLTDLICGSARHPRHYLPSSNSSFSPAPLFWQSQCASSLSEILTWSEDLQTNLDCISSWQDFWFLAAQNCISGNRANLFLKLMLYFLKTRFPFLAERVIKSGSFKVSVVSNFFLFIQFIWQAAYLRSFTHLDTL